MSDQSQDQDKEKKIFIDEDWKSQVQAEKESAEQEPAADKEPSDTAGPLPPANLTVLASSLYLQGMIALGLLPGPGSDKPEVHLDQAKHTIDMLQMLQEKTEGNRTPEESRELERMVHESRLAFVEVQRQQTAAPKT